MFRALQTLLQILNLLQIILLRHNTTTPLLRRRHRPALLRSLRSLCRSSLFLLFLLILGEFCLIFIVVFAGSGSDVLVVVIEALYAGGIGGFGRGVGLAGLALFGGGD